MLKQCGIDCVKSRVGKQALRLKENPRPAAQRVPVRIGGVRNVARNACHIPCRKAEELSVAEFQRAAPLMAIAELQAIVKMERTACNRGYDPFGACEQQNREIVGKIIVPVFYHLFVIARQKNVPPVKKHKCADSTKIKAALKSEFRT